MIRASMVCDIREELPSAETPMSAETASERNFRQAVRVFHDLLGGAAQAFDGCCELVEAGKSMIGIRGEPEWRIIRADDFRHDRRGVSVGVRFL